MILSSPSEFREEALQEETSRLAPSSEWVEFDGCRVEVDDAACTVDDALKALSSALDAVVQAILADPTIAAEHHARILDQQERAEGMFADARRRIVLRCEQHNEERLQNILKWARSI